MLKTTFDDIVNPKGTLSIEPSDIDSMKFVDISLKHVNIYLSIIAILALLLFKISNKTIAEFVLCLDISLIASIFLLSFLTHFHALPIVCTFAIFDNDKQTKNIVEYKTKHFKYYLNSYRLALFSMVVLLIAIYFDFVGSKIGVIFTTLCVIWADLSAVLLRSKIVEISNTRYKYWQEKRIYR